jgi:hypothetical protein
MPLTRPTPKPLTYNADLANLPAALRSRTQERRWVCWKWTWKSSQWTKPPFQACDPLLFAKSNDPETWGDYSVAVAAVAAGEANGIGYMLLGSDLSAIDLDHCRDPQTGEIDEWAQAEIKATDSYVETTVSGAGLRILGIGSCSELHTNYRIPGTANGAKVELFRNTNRFVTISGLKIAGGDKLENIDGVLDGIVERYTAPNTSIGAKTGSNTSIGAKLQICSADIDDLIRNGAPRGIRSEIFAKVVWSLASSGHTPEQIIQGLAAHPGGIASKYVGRLDREVERCFRKWQIKNPKPATSGQAPEWPDWNKDGTLKRTYSNARIAIMALGIVCSYDEFHDRMLVAGKEINQWAGELSDAVNVILRQMIVDQFDFDPGKDNIADATTELCLENRFDPIVDYLEGLDWDTPRLGTWLINYLGAEDTPLNRAIGKLTLIAAVHRARKPGCKFDYIPVLEGPEGTMKSTSIVVLAGVENFSDQTILTASDKEQQELVRGIWVYEIAELTGMKKTEVEKIKAFASRTHDRARPAYGRRRIDAPRRCIFMATTNEDEYLKSDTGNRRFWPVETSTIDIDALRRDRDQLWAEAAEVEAGGIALLLPEELWGEASAAQDERRQHDPWDDLLANSKGEIYPTKDGLAQQEWIKLTELLIRLEIKPDSASPELYKRLKKVMKRLGWTKGRHYFGGETQERGYWRPYPRQ